MSAGLQSQVARFRHLSVDNGLSQNSISSIVQDKKGFIWISTYDGLNKFDGYTVTKYPYTVENGLAGGFIRCMYADDEDNLWLGTSAGGMCRLHIPTNRFTAYKVDSTIKNGIASNSVVEIAEYIKGTLYIATSKGLNLFDKKTGRFTLIQHNDADPNSLLSNSIRTMTRDMNGHIWLGHYNAGLTEYDPKANTFHRFTAHDKGSHLIDHKIRSVYADTRGYLWISLWSSGITIFDLRARRFYTASDTIGPLKDVSKIGLVSQFFEDSKGNMWFCTAEQGLVKYNRDQHEVIYFTNNPDDPESVSDNITFCAMEDKSGLIWSGTWKGGVNYFDPRSLTLGYFKHESNKTNTLNNNNVYAFCETAPGEVLIGTAASASYFNLKTKTFTPFPIHPKDPNTLLANSNVSGILVYKDGSIWFTTGGGGAYRYFPKTGKYKNYNTTADPNSLSLHTPRTLIMDNDNRLWISTLGGGLNLYNDEKDNFTRFANDPDDINTISSDYIPCMTKDREGNIWMGTASSGLIKLDPPSKTFIRYFDKPANNPLPDLGVSSIYFDKAGVMWVGTSGGLCTVDPITRAVKNYAKDFPELSPEFYGITEDTTGNLWLPSNKGLCRFNPKTLQIKVFTREDGIQGKEFNPGALIRLPDGRLLAGGINGFNCFYPAAIREDTVAPQAVITAFNVLNKPYALEQDIAYNSGITLSYRDYFFSFDLAATDFANPQQNKFMYKLENFNDEWVDIGTQHTITFTNLDPGDYVLQVRAANSGGYASRVPMQLKIRITPPFWKTTWFYLLCGLCGILLIYAFIKYRENKLRIEKALLEKKVEERTEELHHEKKKVEEAHQDIKDSILYAKKIQSAIIPTDEDFKKLLPDSFVLFKPKDIVSGDFYWLTEKTGFVFYAVADCTGHGVPGGFMTMLGNGLLNEIVNEHNVTEPAEILNKLREKIITSLKQTGRSGESKDGMDIVLFRLDASKRELCYAAANNAFILVRKDAHAEHAGDKQPVGIYGDSLKPFRQFTVALEKGDTIYSFTDGYPDQFGGPKGKKFKYKQLNDILISNSSKPLKDQKSILSWHFENWKGELEQVDDVCIIGVRV
ncbi:MAG: two-component regulator propeller domain-containing protein [Bacteroidia bacterium]